MDEHTQQIQNETAPTCYRHPDRETWVSCGRCGKPLCTDCMMHGPVGIRCRECLLPQGQGVGLGAGIVDPEDLRKALIAGAMLACAWAVVIFGLSAYLGIYAFRWLPPNYLLAGIAGATVGWLIRDRCHGMWNQTTTRTALLLGLAIPLLAAVGVILLVWSNYHPHSHDWVNAFDPAGDLRQVTSKLFFARAVFTAGISAFFAWLLSSGRQ